MTFKAFLHDQVRSLQISKFAPQGGHLLVLYDLMILRCL